MSFHSVHSIASRKHCIKALVALAAVGFALVVAVPGFAETNTGKAPAKKGCSVQLQGPGAGQSIVYPDGYKFSVYATNDHKTHTYTCNDGKWTETASITAAGRAWRNVAILATSGTLQAVQLTAGTLQAVQLRR
jgi:hypothetical protein